MGSIKRPVVTLRRPLSESPEVHHHTTITGFFKERGGVKERNFLECPAPSTIAGAPHQNLGDRCFHSRVPEAKAEGQRVSVKVTASVSPEPGPDPSPPCCRACHLSLHSLGVQGAADMQDAQPTLWGSAPASWPRPAWGPRRPEARSLWKEGGGGDLPLWSRGLVSSPP